jgi:hypothetical protein
MKHRARRVTIGAAILVVAVLTAFVIIYRDTVRDHLEAWRFQVTRKMHVMMPDPDLEGEPQQIERVYVFRRHGVNRGDLLRMLADHSGVPVVLDAQLSTSGYESLTADECTSVTSSTVLHCLRECGWRIVEQYGPRRAYVVLHGETSSAFGVPRPLVPR